MSGWSNVPAGKNKYDRLTRGGVTKYWNPGPLGLGGSYQTAATLNAQRQKEGKPPIDFSKKGLPKSKTIYGPGGDPSGSGKGQAQQIKPKPLNPVTIKNTQGKTQQVTPGKGYSYTKPDGTRGYMVYDTKGKSTFTAYPKQPQTPAGQPSAGAGGGGGSISAQPPARPSTPPAPPVETRMSAVTGKKEYVGTTSGGQKFERRAATRAELEAAQKARKETLSAGKTKPEAEKAAVTAGIAASKTQKEEVMTREPYDVVLEYLFSQGHVDTLEEALYVMMQMSSEYIQNIVEQEGFRSDGRYQLPDGRTMGPIPGAFRALFTGNLPKSRTYIPPSTQTPTNRPPAVPPSKDDSGKLTDFGAGGGKAKMKQGMSVGQVERQGRRNRGDYSG